MNYPGKMILTPMSMGRSFTLRNRKEKKINRAGYAYKCGMKRRMEKKDAWIRQKLGVTEEECLLAQLKKRKLSMYGHWKC